MQWHDYKLIRYLQILKRGYGNYRWSIALLVVLGIFSGLFEGIGVNAVIPMFSFLTRDANGPSDAISRALSNLFAFFHVDFSLKFLLIFIVLLFVFRSVVLLLASIVKIKISAKYEAQTRKRLFSAFLGARWPFLMQQKLGHLETVLLTNIRYSSLVLEHLCMIIITAANLFIYLLIAFNISASITVVTLGLGIVLFIVLKPLLASTKKYSRVIESLNKQISHFVNENILGMKTVKAMALGTRVADIGNVHFEDLRKQTVKISMLRSIGDVFMQPIGIIFISALFAWSYRTPGFQLGVFAATIYLVQRIFVYFIQMQASVRMINECAPYVTALLAIEEKVKLNREPEGSGSPFLFKDSLDFMNVGFSYGNDRQTLTDVNLSIRHGETVGIIGPSGSGKTTLVDLVLRLFEPRTGMILLDGKDIREIRLDEWRMNIGYVSQDIFLMNDTIAANISFHDSSISEKDIKVAAKKANIYEFIDSLPEKFNTVIGERGIFLSAGQRQRIIIARVLAREPKILVLDEATSALDNESEKQIQSVIEGLRGELTVIIVAHRLSTVMGADRVVVLENGRVIEDGVPQALLANENSYFHRVYNIK